MPDPADAVAQVEFDLGAVERALARLNFPRQALRLPALLQRIFGLVPLLVRAHPLLGPGRELGGNIRKAEILVNAEQQVDKGSSTSD